MHLARYSILDDPESVKAFIASKKDSSYKHMLTKAYNYYAKTHGIMWIRPKYPVKKGIPRPPTTEQVQLLIGAATRKFAPVLKLMAETGASPSEVEILTGKNFDFERNTVYIKGRKGHLDRIVPIKPELAALIKAYLTTYKFPSAENIKRKFRRYRDKLARNLKDNSIRKVRCYDLRHYFGTMTYYKTKDILYTKYVMGHSKIETTLNYTKLVNFESNEWVSAVARTLKEACSLIEAGFEYVTEMDGVQIFRKRK